MVNATPSRDAIKDTVEPAVRQAGPWVEKLARMGYAAKGVIYMIIGMLALQAAFSSGGKTTNSEGALATIVEQPFGRVLLGVVGVGLAGYALWRFVAAAIDAENEGSDAKGIATRLGYVISGIVYAVLSFTAFQIIGGTASGDGGNSGTQDWTARLLAAPFGQLLTGLAGAIVIGSGLRQMVKGYKGDFKKDLELGEIPPAQQKSVVSIGRAGYIARGIVFAIMGGFVINAAMNADPRRAKGLGSALDLLAQQPYGPWVLGIVAAGLVAYGVFMIVEARYRRFAV
ncbi:MAG: DUF1206 domain-containing protein [Fibrella sp.]|nr:DUF1206 domain-containing protein [Armatimonadota bacterium]